eukprot:3769361-Pleurochrysis_carterae.AAC.3
MFQSVNARQNQKGLYMGVFKGGWKVQDLAHAAAIIDTYHAHPRKGERSPRAALFVADAEPACCYCPVQHSDL